MGEIADQFAVFESATYWKSTQKLGRGFAAAYPDDAARVAAYVAELDAGNYAVTPPPVSTLHAKGIVGTLAALAKKIPAAPPPPPPPPPPSGTRLGNGFVTDLQGSRYGQMTDAERANYGGLTVGFGNEIDAANFEKTHPSCHGFGYQTSVEVGSNTWYGAVLVDECRRNGWLLKDSFGAEITNGYGLYMADVGNPAYRQAWCDAVAARAAATGLHRKFLDNVTGTMMVGAAGSVGLAGRLRAVHPDNDAPSEFVAAATHRFGSWFARTPINPRTNQPYTDATWQTDYLGFLAHQHDHLAGVYRLGNIYSSDRLAWTEKAIAHLDGGMVEYFDGSDAHLALLTAIQSAGKDAWALVDPSHGQPAPDTAAGIALAQKFASVWDRKGGGLGFVGTGVWRSGAGTWTAAISA